MDELFVYVGHSDDNYVFIHKIKDWKYDTHMAYEKLCEFMLIEFGIYSIILFEYDIMYDLTEAHLLGNNDAEIGKIYDKITDPDYKINKTLLLNYNGEHYHLNIENIEKNHLLNNRADNLIIYKYY